MISIGDTLRRERMRRNLDIGPIAAELRISSRFLEAIEAEQFDKLPGGVFTKSFVRQYAAYLGLDAEELVAEVQKVLEPAPEIAEPLEKAKPDVPGIRVEYVEEWRSVSDRNSRIPSWITAGAMLVALMLVCSGIYWLWERSRRPTVAEAFPSQRTPLAPTSSAAPKSASTPPAAPVVPESTAVEPPSSQSAAATEQASAAPPPAPTPAAGSAPPALPANPNASVRLAITADQPVWISAHSNGKFLFSATLQAHETRNIDADGEVELRLGNAGGATVTLNGKPVGPLGPKGQPRTVQFTSGGMVLAPPKSVDPLARL